MRVSLQARRGRSSTLSCLLSASTAVAVAALAQSASGQVFWDSGGGGDQNWSNAANWNTNTGADQEPTASDSAVLNNGGTIVVNQLGEACSRFQMGRSNYALTPTNTANLGLSGTFNMMTGGQLVDSGAFDMGTYTAGGPQAPTTSNLLNVTGGELDTGEFMRVGVAAGSGALVTQSAGVVSIATNFPGSGTGQLNIGDRGTGTYNISGGNLAVLRQIVVGLNTTAVGTFNISGGTVSNTNDFVVGNEAAPTTGTNAFLSLTGGSVTTSGRYMIGFNAGASGQATHSTGTFQAGQVDVGRAGTGSLTLSGNTTMDSNSVVAVAKYVGATAPSNGTLTVTGNAVLRTGGLNVGNQGNGVLNFNGGTITVLGVTRGAGFPSTDDPYNPELLNLLIGRDGGGDVATGNGVVNHSGGTLTVASNMVIGDFDDSNGVYNVSGGALAVTGNVNVGSALASNAPANPVDTQGQAVGAKGTFHVIGNAATINIGGNFVANPADRVRTGTPNQATLAFDIGSSAGTSVINVGGVADLDGAVIDMTLTGTSYVPAYQAQYTLFTAGSFGATGTGSTQNNGTGMGFALAADDMSDWQLSVVTSGGHSSIVATNQVVPGDTNNDKKVQFNDLLALAQHFNQLSGQTRATGDFNRSGGVDFADLLILAQNFGFGTNPGATLDMSALPAGFAADWALAQSLVPEPTSLTAMSAAMLLTRRRRAVK